ncbi:hypothetical protein [Sinomonas halotolerans]|uniref:Uncharacterized protein n=1 Tax=Sinomonas halotolerans TaxID=1644133 RepID=A0ABU9X0B8_9MICC
MPKSRTRKPKNTRPKTSAQPGVYERTRTTIGLLVDRVTPEYIAWASQGEEDVAAFAAGQLGIVKAFATIVQAVSDGAPGYRFEPGPTRAFLGPFLDDVAAASEDDSAAVDDQRYVVGTLIDWLTFLEETGRWDGTAEDLVQVSEVLDEAAEALGGIVDASPRDQLPLPTEEEAADFAANAPFVRHAKALLEWAGAGREVDADGGLTPSGLTDAAALVGSKERAARLWEAMLAAELVTLDSGTARPGEGAADLGGTDGLARLEAQFLGTEIVVAACTAGAPGSDEGTAASILTTVLDRALDQEPFPLEDIASLGAGQGEDLGIEEELGAGATAQLKDLGEALLGEVRELEALGLVDTSDGMVAIPVAALDAVYDALVDEEADQGDYLDPGFEDRELDEV